MAKTLNAKAQEVFDNCGFTFKKTNDSGRDIYECERTHRDGKPCPKQVYRQTVTGHCCWSCDCYEGQRLAAEGFGLLCKHCKALEFWLADGAVPVIVPVKVEAAELKFVTKPAASGWSLCGL